MKKMLCVLLPLAVLLLPGATASHPCSEPTKAKCKAQTPAQGCEWVNGECVQPCSYTPTQGSCEANPLCFYSPAIGCNEKCGNFPTMVNCTASLACDWTGSCADACMLNIAQSTCMNASGCAWNSGRNQCELECKWKYSTKSSCESDRSCIWERDSCQQMQSPQFGQQLEEKCGGIIGSFMYNITSRVTGLNETVCMMQGKTAGGGLMNGLICSGARNATLTDRYFDQPNRNFTCGGNNDKKVQVNGVYMLPTSQAPKKSCKGVIGSFFYDVPLLSGGTQKYCLMQGKTQFGGLQDGLVCTGVRNATLTERIFDQPNRNFTCSDGTIFENGVYSTA